MTNDPRPDPNTHWHLYAAWYLRSESLTDRKEALESLTHAQRRQLHYDISGVIGRLDDRRKDAHKKLGEVFVAI